MINLLDWLQKYPNYHFVQLFEHNSDLYVETNIKLVSSKPRRLLKRIENMEKSIIEIIENGLEQESWEGILYIVGTDELSQFKPLYIGKTERRGVNHPVSTNIKNISKNKHMFARWGDGLDYHIGDLSHSLFNFEAYRKPTKKYKRWANSMFKSFDPPVLKDSVFLYLAPWFSDSVAPSGFITSLPAAEKEVIALASEHFRESLLNIDGV